LYAIFASKSLDILSKQSMETYLALFTLKVDLLPTKLRLAPLSKYFPEVPPEKEMDVEFAVSFFRSKFEAMLKGSHVATIFFHTTCAIDTRSFEKVYESIRTSVIGNQFTSVGL
jgi:hypothetical protein